MNAFTTRAVTGAPPDLVAALTEIHRKVFPPHMQFDDAPRYFEEALADERNLNILLQDQNGTLIGYLLGIPQSHVFEELRQWDPEFQDDPERLYLEMIQILPEQRGSKLGLRLIQRVCAEAEKKEYFQTVHACQDGHRLERISPQDFRGGPLSATARKLVRFLRAFRLPGGHDHPANHGKRRRLAPCRDRRRCGIIPAGFT
ncbi:MAG TPA: GNAT family N-acetyltransferase [Desulfuromonadales bacterium]